MRSLWLVVLLLFIQTCICSPPQTAPIFLAAFLPTNAQDAATIRTRLGLYPQVAAEMAVEHVNQREVLFPYHFELLVYPSGCIVAEAVARFIKLKSNPRNGVHIVLGPACDQPALALADLVRRYSLVQVSHAAQTPEISQLQQYPYTFRTVSSYFTYRNPINAILQFFDWLFINVIHSELRAYTRTLESLGELLSKTPDAQLQQSIGEANLLDVSLEGLGRVFVVLVPEDTAPSIMCTAFRRGLTGPDYQWILPGDFARDWWRNGSVDCSSEEMRQAVESSLIATHSFETDPSDAPTVSGLTLEEFWNEFEARVEMAGLRFEGDKVSRVTTTYDAVWSLALALNTSIPTFMDRELNLTKYSQTSAEFTDLVTQVMEQTNFTGVSGRVEFTNQEHGIGNPTTRVLQMQNGQMVPIGVFDSQEDTLNMTFFRNELAWQGAGPPQDRPTKLLQSVDLWIVVVMLFLAGAGTVLAIVLLVINCVYRKHKVIKASSPYINLLIIIGCINGFAAVVFITVDAYFDFSAGAAATFGIVCNVTPWLISIGFNLSFGALFAKEWRLYRIFKNPWNQNRRPLKDYHLFATVLLLLTVNAIVLAAMEAALPLELVTVLVEESSDFTVEKHQLCATSDFDRFINLIVAISVPKGLMLLFGVFLTSQNSKIKSKFFNDAKFLGIAIYGVIITCGVGVPISFFTMFAFEEDLSYIASTLTINICSYLILITVFVPKLFLLRQYRHKVPVPVLLGLNPSFRLQSKKQAVLSRISRKENGTGDNIISNAIEDTQLEKKPQNVKELIASWEPAYDAVTMDTGLEELQEESIEFGESDVELYSNYFALEDTDHASWHSTDTLLTTQRRGFCTRSMIIIPTD